MNQKIIQTIDDKDSALTPDPNRQRDFGGKKRPNSKIRQLPRSNKTDKNGWFTPLVSTIEAFVPSALVVVNNNSSSETDRKFIDQQLAANASLTSRITQETMAGREPRVVYDEVGFPPFTFSLVSF